MESVLAAFSWKRNACAHTSTIRRPNWYWTTSNHLNKLHLFNRLHDYAHVHFDRAWDSVAYFYSPSAEFNERKNIDSIMNSPWTPIGYMWWLKQRKKKTFFTAETTISQRNDWMYEEIRQVWRRCAHLNFSVEVHNVRNFVSLNGIWKKSNPLITASTRSKSS